jgi:hypothetical protein
MAEFLLLLGCRSTPPRSAVRHTHQPQSRPPGSQLPRPGPYPAHRLPNRVIIDFPLANSQRRLPVGVSRLLDKHIAGGPHVWSSRHVELASWAAAVARIAVRFDDLLGPGKAFGRYSRHEVRGLDSSANW